MKAKKRILTLVFTLVLTTLISVFAVSAEQTQQQTQVPQIKANTLSLKETVYLLYAVDFGEIPEGAEYGMLVWEMEEGAELPASFTHKDSANASDLKSAGWQNVGGTKCQIFTYSGLAAKQMTDYVYSVAYVKRAGDSEYTYSLVSKYSILQYTIGSALNDSNKDLLLHLRDYGARAQEYFGYRTDRLADEKYVLANVSDGLLSDGTRVGAFKPGENVSLTGGKTPLVSGTKTQWYVCADGIGKFYDGSFVAPESNCTVSSSVVFIDENFNSASANASGVCSGAGVFSFNNKGQSRYYLVSDGNGGKYIRHYKAASAGNDSQGDSGNYNFNMQKHLYDASTQTYADKKITVSIKLARTADNDVARASFNLRHYNSYWNADGSVSSNRAVDYTTNVFAVDVNGNVMLGNKLQVGYLSTEWQEFSFVIDFAAGDVDGANNIFAYRNGILIGSARAADFTSEKYLEYTDSTDRMIVNFHTTGDLEGELLFDDIKLSVGQNPKSEKKDGIVNYVLNGGKLPLDVSLNYVPGEVTVLPTPTKENYDFCGWYSSPSLSEDTKIEEFIVNEHKAVTVYAKFTPSSEYIDLLKNTNNAFNTEDFYRVDTDNEYNLPASEGGVGDKYALVGYGESVTMNSIIKMDTSKYEPPSTPAGKQHPYLFFSASDIPKIIETFNSEEFEATAARLWQLANDTQFTGEFAEAEKNGVPYRFSTTVLAQLEAKALAYILTGDVSYGYQAIIGAKNAMLTLVYTQNQHMDPYHGASQTMTTVAKVYDWCYDLLSETDKTQIILGVQNLMCPTLEYNLFQKEQGLANSNPVPSAVNGHGTGPQFIRDYVTVALAFFTEETSWWDFIGGRYIAEYAPVIDYAYQGGWASQGTATYGTSKYFINMWAAWVIRSATGYTVSYAIDDGGSGREAAYFINSHIMANDRYFSTGDGGRNSNGSAINYEYMVLAAAFYADPALEAFAKYYTNGYSKWSYDFTEEMTASMTVVFGAFFAEDVPEGEYENRGDGVDLIQYFSYPNGFMSARDSWDEDAAVVMMKIGEMTMANHDIGDHGTFQIYYKGMLATSSGAYNKYGSNVHTYYLQSTIGQNGLLIFNPELADEEPVYNANGDITNGKRYYYSGSQKQMTAGSTFEQWIDGRSKTGEVYGHEAAYNADGSAKHAYIAGDITTAYNLSTVDYVGRRMLTIYTGNPDYPMLFFTFDQMTSDGADFTKTFLLHTVKEPTVDEETMSAVITDGDGKLVLHSLSGADSIRKIGGEGYAYWINGKNCLDQYTTSDNADKIWGRIELNTVGNLYDSLLTAMYVTDASNEEMLDVKGYETDYIKFATVENYVVGFMNSQAPVANEFTIGTQGEGLYTYYISGLGGGDWTVKVDDTVVASVKVADESGLAVFTAPTGKITITPTEDVVGIGRGKIIYQTGGGILPSDAVEYFSSDEVTPLSAIPTRGNDQFLGWFLSENCAPDELITEIPAGLGGSNITVYAKWQKVLVNETYATTQVSVGESTTKSVSGITYNAGSSGESKPGSTHTTVTGSDGNKYLRVTSTGSNSCIYVSDSSYNLSHFTETSISYEFDVAKLSGYSTANLQLLITTSGGNYGHLNNLLTLTTARKYTIIGSYVTTVKLGNTTVSGISISQNFTTIRMTIDFAAAKTYLYDANGSVIASSSLSVPSAASGYAQPATLADWQKVATPIYFRMEVTKSGEGSSCALAFDNIKVTEGNAFANKTFTEGKNFVKYNTNGGTLGSSAIGIYSSTTATPLPTDIKNGDKIFSGWYTTPTFDEGTRMKEIPAGTSGTLNLYAKWTDPMLCEDFENINVDCYQNAATVNGFSYNANNSGCSLKTFFDASGNTYVIAKNSPSDKAGNNNGIIYSYNKSSNLTTFKETAISYEFKLKKQKDVALPALSLSIQTSGGKHGAFTILSSGSDGNVRLAGTSTVIGTITENSYLTIRVTVDFALGKIYAYDAQGNVISEKSQGVPTVKAGETQPSTFLEWQKIADNYNFYLSYSPTDPTSAVCVDDIKIVDGRAF